MRMCRTCGVHKSDDEFKPSVRYRCKSCHAHYDKHGFAPYNGRWYCQKCDEMHPEGQFGRTVNSEGYSIRYCKVGLAHYDRKRNYGLEREDFEAMLLRQANQCWICAKDFPPPLEVTKLTAPHVDHDHDTGAIRGLLCTGCNRTLGRYELGRNPNWKLAARADEYLDLSRTGGCV